MPQKVLDCKATFNFEVEELSDIPDVPLGTHLACDWGNEKACREDNNLRAMWGAAALKEYAGNVGEDEMDVTFSDLLSDLMHLADALELDFDHLIDKGRSCYEPESEGRW